MFVVKHPINEEIKIFSTKEKGEKYLLDFYFNDLNKYGYDYLEVEGFNYDWYVEEETDEGETPITKEEYILMILKDEGIFYEIKEIE